MSGLVSEAKKAYLREADSHYNRAFTLSDTSAQQLSGLQAGVRRVLTLVLTATPQGEQHLP